MGCSRFAFGLQDAGVALVFGSVDDDVDQLASIMKEFTAVVACLPSGTASQGDLKLIEAAGKAGTITRYVPSGIENLLYTYDIIYIQFSECLAGSPFREA